jgi:predicted RND superfamily exporter protein
MLTLVNILILFFTILVIYQIFLASFGDSIIEGLTSDNQNYQPYDTNDPLILGKQNAANIIVLKNQMDDMSGLNKQVQDLSGNVSLLQDQVNNLVVSQNAYASSTIPSTAPDISGTTDDSTTNDSTMTN